MPFARPLGQPSVRASPTDPLATRRRATVRTLNPLPATSGERRSGGASRRDTRRRSSHGAVLGVPAEPGARSPHHAGSHAWRGGLVCVAISFTVGVARASHRRAIAWTANVYVEFFRVDESARPHRPTRSRFIQPRTPRAAPAAPQPPRNPLQLHVRPELALEHRPVQPLHPVAHVAVGV